MNRVFIVLLIMAMLAGCSTEQPVVEVALPVYTPQVNTLSAESAQIEHVASKQVVLDGILAQTLLVEDIRKSKTNDGYGRIEVLVKNIATTPLRIRYRFDWQDANGVMRSDLGQDAWEKVTIVAGDNARFSSIAPRKDCADFRLRMKNVE